MKKIKVPCLCCGCKTIDEGEAGAWQICPVCFWENDKTDGDIHSISGANRTTLLQAQKNYLEFGACDIRMIKNVRQPKHSEEINIDWKPFDP